MARKNAAFHRKINGMGVVQGELKKAAVGSSDQRNGSFEGISRRLEAKRFSWPCIEPKGDLIKVMLSVNG
jgi:hypothetical protein